MEIPVYLFTGFLEAGKTKFLQETLCDPSFMEKGPDRTLVLMCEEGEEELDPRDFASKNVFVETIDAPSRVNPDKLEALRRKTDASRVMIEYNGMWLLSDLFRALPEGWFVCQQMFFADSNTIGVFNANMRNLVVDKLQNCDLVVFNRCSENETDYEALHKLVRGVSRRTDIVYETLDGNATYDDIEDPLPFDVSAPIIEIGDRDYALFYRDLSDNMDTYHKKTVRYLAQVNRPSRHKDGFVLGRPIMTCCAEDITFSGLFCENGADQVENGEWIRITAELTVKRSKLYGRKGPVLRALRIDKAEAPADPVATFY